MHLFGVVEGQICFQDAKNYLPKGSNAFSQIINSFVVLSKIWVGLKVGDTGSAPKIQNNSEHDGKVMALGEQYFRQAVHIRPYFLSDSNHSNLTDDSPEKGTSMTNIYCSDFFGKTPTWGTKNITAVGDLGARYR